jgi:opacity protein-like surface antigen
MSLAQATATATRAIDIQIGGGFTSISPDSQPDRFNGGAAYFDVNFKAHLGVEGEFHFATDSQGTGRYEKTYEIGGRYFRTYGRFLPYAKALYGRGVYNFTDISTNSPPAGPYTYVPVANLAYNLVAAGIGVDYELLQHVDLRADWEYQRWFSFEGSSLSPNLVTVGAAYHF